MPTEWQLRDHIRAVELVAEQIAAHRKESGPAVIPAVAVPSFCKSIDIVCAAATQWVEAQCRQ